MNLVELALELGIEINIDTRWEAGTPHHPESEVLLNFLKEIDSQNDFVFDWKSGGDGDIGESLMYQLDPLFELLDFLEEAEKLTAFTKSKDLPNQRKNPD
jgi:hypothetical protein